MSKQIIKFNRDGSRSEAVSVSRQIDAPYVEPVKAMLGDKHLDPEESVIREREDLLKQAAKMRIHGQDELEQSERSAGPRMGWTELLRKLWKCNPQIRVKDGSPGSIALYILKKPWESEESDYTSEDRPKDDFFVDHKYVGGFQKESMPEYSHVTLDTSNLPVRELRGWRSVLIKLIKAGVISYRAAIQEFGDPSLDQRSRFWCEQLAQFRRI